jgi:hypothetical protein
VHGNTTHRRTHRRRGARCGETLPDRRKDVTYHGPEQATPQRVRHYLKDNYVDPDGTPLSQARLTELLTDHDPTVQTGIMCLSYAYYVGDQIAEAADLRWNSGDTDNVDTGNDPADAGDTGAEHDDELDES